MPYSISRLTEDPDYNIKLGTYYLNSLLKDYNEFILLLLPHIMLVLIVSKLGDELMRPTKNQISYINWIELIRSKKPEIMFKEFFKYKFMLSTAR